MASYHSKVDHIKFDLVCIYIYISKDGWNIVVSWKVVYIHNTILGKKRKN